MMIKTENIRFLNKQKCIWLAMFSIVFSAVMTLSRIFIYSGDIFGKVGDNYAREIMVSDILLFVFGCVVFCAAFIALTVFYDFAEKHWIHQNQREVPSLKKQTAAFFIISAIMFVCWLPYLLSNMPGAIFVDGFSSISQVIAGIYNNHHPLLYTLFAGIFIKIGILSGSLLKGIALYTIAQMLIMIAVMAHFMIWLYKKNVSRWYIATVMIFIAFFPLFPYYAVTFWKDTLFSLALFHLVLIYIDIFLSGGKYLYSTRGIVHYCVTAFLVCFLRNNGLYIYIFSLLFLVFIYRHFIFKYLKKFIICAIVLLIGTVIIQGPVYSEKKLSTEFVENLAIPMQQIFSVVGKNGDYSEEDRVFISNIWDIDEIKEKYTPCNADTPKVYMSRFDDTFLEDHKAAFFKLWLRLFVDNPCLYMEAFLNQNIGFWNINASGPEAYFQTGVWPNNMGLEQRDYFLEIFGFSFNSIVSPQKYISSGLLFWLMMGSALISVLRSKKDPMAHFIPYIPVIGAWLTIMVAAPLGISFRYMYILLLFVPLLPVIPLMNNDHGDWRGEVKNAASDFEAGS